jgi:hypothetical protein
MRAEITGKGVAVEFVWDGAQALLRKQRGFAHTVDSPLTAAVVDDALGCVSALASGGAIAK